jgi:hypothetical protein
VLVTIGTNEFRECPVRFLDAETEHVVAMWRGGLYRDARVEERVHVPARLHESVAYLDTLKGSGDGN